MDEKDVIRRLKANHGKLARKLVEDVCGCSDLSWDVDKNIKSSLREYCAWWSALVFTDKKHDRYYVVNIQEASSLSLVVYYTTSFYRTFSRELFGDELEELYAKVFGMEYVEYIEKNKKEKLKTELSKYMRTREVQISQRIEKLTEIVNQASD